MSRNDIEPTGAASMWPLARQGRGELAFPDNWGQRTHETGQGIDLNLATIWRILSEWRWLILGTIVAALAGAVIVTLLTTPLYRATSVLEVNPPSVEILEDSKATASPANDADFLATQYGLLASRTLAQRVAQELNLASNDAFVSQEGDRGSRTKIATRKLETDFEVEPVQKSRLIRIHYISESPQLAAQVVNSFADGFINSNLERRYEASSYARTFLEKQISSVKGELEKSERQLVAYAQQQGIINTASGQPGEGGDAGSLQGASLIALNEALAAAQTTRISAEQAYRQSRNGGTTAEANERTSALRNARAALEAEYQQKLASFKPEYPEMLRLRAQIGALEQQIRLVSGAVAAGRSNTLLADFRAAAAAERNLQSRVSQLKGDVLNLRGRSIQYNILQREVDTNRSLYDALLQRYKEIGVAGGIGKNLVSVVDRAEVPDAPYRPNLILNLIIGLMLGLMAGMATALMIEFLNDTIKTPDDVRDKLRLPSLGVIPRKSGQGSLAEELEDQSSPISEAYFSLRTSLQFTSDAGAPKTLLLTSTRAAEGKSSTTLALAQNFARLGKNVLLIDADLRKPAFVTDSLSDEGLSKLLASKDPVRQHVLKTESENLWLIPCGPLPPNPAELLASPRLKAVIAEAAEHFDMVIVDGPPVLGLADAPLLGAACEATLMAVESGKTRTKAAIDAVNRLNASGSQIVGAVLTKYRHRSQGYGYSYEPYEYGGVGSREREIRLIAQREA